MDPATLALLQQIIQVIIQAVELGVQYGPQIWTDLKSFLALITSGTALTSDQITAANATLDAAHTALQAKLTADVTNDQNAAAASSAAS